MKKFLLFVILPIIFSVVCYSQEQSVLKWDEKVHDFGKVDSQKQDEVSFVFHCEVIGETPIVIHEVKATCGCTRAEWTRHAVRPNKKGEVQVFVNLKTLKGSFDKRLFVKTSRKNNVELLRVKSFVK